MATIGAPAAFFNLVDGQNGYYSAALLVWGLTLADRRPMLAGLLLGTLCFKPQLGVLLPVALVAGRQWRALAAAAAWAILLVAASIILLGPGAWLGFFDQMVVERGLLQFGSSTWAGMPTVFVLMRMAGTDLTAAYLMQGVSAISATAAVALLWYRRSPFSVKSAGLAVGIFLVTPHAYYYDMIILIFAAAWLADEAVKYGFPAMGKNRHFNLIGSPGSFTFACTGRFSNRADPIVADNGRDPSVAAWRLPEPELRPDFLVRTSPRQPFSGLARDLLFA